MSSHSPPGSPSTQLLAAPAYHSNLTVAGDFIVPGRAHVASVSFLWLPVMVQCCSLAWGLPQILMAPKCFQLIVFYSIKHL